MPHPNISHIQHFLRQQYGLDASIERLPGEKDLNFRVSSDQGGFVLKVMHSGCGEALVDLQVRALDHLQQHLPTAPVPGVRKTLADHAISRFEDTTTGPRLAWLISQMPGNLMAQTKPWDAIVGASIGHIFAQLDKALATFSHSALNRTLEWDLRQSHWLGERSQSIENLADRRLVESIADHFHQTLSPQLESLERVPIHGDGNDMNILLAQSPGSAAKITGVIDFGDMVATPRVCEPAIAAAYVMMGEGDALARCVSLIGAYHREYPMSDAELALLPSLIRLRWAVSVTNAAHNRRIDPDNAYLSVSEGESLALLRGFSDNAEGSIGSEILRRISPS